VSKYMGHLYLITAASLWGGIYVVSKIVMEVIQPMELVWIRYIIAILVLLIIGKLMHVSWHIQKKYWSLIILISLCGYVISIWAQFAGTQLSSAQFGSVITAASPAFMVIFAKIILHEQITLRKGMAVTLATLGVLLIIGMGQINGQLRSGAILLLIAAITWALVSVLIKKVPDGYSMLVITTYTMIVAFLVITPIELPKITGTMLVSMLNPSIAACILYIGVFATAIAFYFWNKGLQKVDASTAGIYFFFQPLCGTLGGWLFLGEKIGISFLIGTALILSSVVLTAKK